MFKFKIKKKLSEIELSVLNFLIRFEFIQNENQ